MSKKVEGPCVCCGKPGTRLCGALDGWATCLDVLCGNCVHVTCCADKKHMTQGEYADHVRKIDSTICAIDVNKSEIELFSSRMILQVTLYTGQWGTIETEIAMERDGKIFMSDSLDGVVFRARMSYSQVVKTTMTTWFKMLKDLKKIDREHVIDGLKPVKDFLDKELL